MRCWGAHDVAAKQQCRLAFNRWVGGGFVAGDDVEGGGGGEVFEVNRTNLQNEGLISADRRTKPTLMLTIPRSIFKSSTRDLSCPIFGIMIQRTHDTSLRHAACVAIL